MQMVEEREGAATSGSERSTAFVPIFPHRHHNRHPWAQPGDEPDRIWILRFADADRREMLWTGPGAEARAKAAYLTFVPSWNVYLFATLAAEEIQ
jgi:hypothetical protein